MSFTKFIDAGKGIDTYPIDDCIQLVFEATEKDSNISYAVFEMLVDDCVNQ